MKIFRTILILVAGLGGTSEVLADAYCDRKDGIILSGAADAPWNVQVQLKPTEVPLNAPFDATVIICSETKELPVQIEVDAVMPAHKHGMNYEPKIVQIYNHRYEIKNLVLHMPGIWRLEITAYKDGEPYRFTRDLQLQ